MQRTLACFTAVVVSVVLTACGSFTRMEGAPVGIDGVACVGTVGEPLAQAVSTSDTASLNEARAATDKGGVCAARAFVAQQPVKVYRVFDSSRGSSAMGRWWSLTKPEGPREKYRQDYAICAAWSALDRLTSCTIKPGAIVVIGTTQSVACEEGTYPKSANHQVYLQNDLAKGQLVVENCSDEGAWP